MAGILYYILRRHRLLRAGAHHHHHHHRHADSEARNFVSTSVAENKAAADFVSLDAGILPELDGRKRLQESDDERLKELP